jgi:hypothetical protein
LDNNHISGTIPQEMANDGRLRLLYLGNNNLKGSIPDMFDSMNTLSTFEFIAGVPWHITAFAQVPFIVLLNRLCSGSPASWESLQEYIADDDGTIDKLA